MTREQIKEHLAEVVYSVLEAQSKVAPSLDERINKLPEDHTWGQAYEAVMLYSSDIAEMMISEIPDEILQKEYGKE